MLANKERLECSSENGTVSIDKEVVYRLGDVLTVVLSEVNQDTRNLIAKPSQAVVAAKADD